MTHKKYIEIITTNISVYNSKSFQCLPVWRDRISVDC